jgi:hypothetical protein
MSCAALHGTLADALLAVGVAVALTDGTAGAFDLVVRADGLRSGVTVGLVPISAERMYP